MTHIQYVIKEMSEDTNGVIRNRKQKRKDKNMVSSTNKADRNNITGILLTIIATYHTRYGRLKELLPVSIFIFCFFCFRFDFLRQMLPYSQSGLSIFDCLLLELDCPFHSRDAIKNGHSSLRNRQHQAKISKARNSTQLRISPMFI